MPHVRERVGKFFESPAYTALNPMEVVALGAAVQAGILAGTSRDVLLLDIIPLSLGIETLGGAVAKLISKGTHIPAGVKEIFSTSVEGQTNVKIHVLQGERGTGEGLPESGGIYSRGDSADAGGVAEDSLRDVFD